MMNFKDAVMARSQLLRAFRSLDKAIRYNVWEGARLELEATRTALDAALKHVNLDMGPGEGGPKGDREVMKWMSNAELSEELTFVEARIRAIRDALSLRASGVEQARLRAAAEDAYENE